MPSLLQITTRLVWAHLFLLRCCAFSQSHNDPQPVSAAHVRLPLTAHALVEPEVEKEPTIDSSGKGPSPSSPPPPPRRGMVVSSELELPFSAEIAYDAFSDLTRQPEWSPWLHSVEFIDDDPTTLSTSTTSNGESSRSSKWSLKVMGVTYSWKSIATRQDRPHVIEWESISGLKNFGKVSFQPYGEGEGCRMIMTMTFVPPRLVSAVFRNSKGLKNFMERKLIGTSLCMFRDVVIDTTLAGPFNATMIFLPI